AFLYYQVAAYYDVDRFFVGPMNGAFYGYVALPAPEAAPLRQGTVHNNAAARRHLERRPHVLLYIYAALIINVFSSSIGK
ncbi:MAG: hypothetical protein UX61_C0029G0007, partial [Parcubacteria group bacterium GW2011_GWA2_46_7]